MLRFLCSGLSVLSVLVLFGGAAARAEIFVFQDAGTKASLSVPDTWGQVNNQKPDDVVTFMAPGANDFAVCRLQVRDDGRFKIFPVRYSDEIQRQHYSAAYWDEYLARYDDVTMHGDWDNSGLGRGFASYAEASFVTPGSPKIAKRGLMFAARYGDQDYVFECSAQANAYHKWHNAFLSVAKPTVSPAS